jgi:hypothetical protein
MIQRILGRYGQMAVTALVCLACFTQSAFAELFKWVDEAGGVHYTDDLNKIPAPFRPKQTSEIQKESTDKKPVSGKEQIITATATPSSTPKIIAPPTGPMRSIPPIQSGSIPQMWGGFAEDDTVYFPASGIPTSQDVFVQEKATTIADPHLGELRVTQTINGETLNFLVVFTDPRMLDASTPFVKQSVITLMKQILYDETMDGIYFNAPTSVFSDDTKTYGMNRYGICEVLGFLLAPQDNGKRPYHELANQAAADKKWFETIYYWAMSQKQGRPGDDWREGEVSKLTALWEMNFPKAQDRVKGELTWFENSHGVTAATKALRKRMER